MLNIPPNILEDLKEKMKMPEGTFVFKYTSSELLNLNIPWWIIFENIAWWHIFRLIRTDNLSLDFYYSSPWTGTKLASIDLSKIDSGTTSFKIIFKWSTENIWLYIWPQNPEWELLLAEGGKSDFDLQVGKSWSIYSIGGKRVSVTWIKVFQNWKKELQSTAINSWNETKKAIEILKTGQSTEWFIFEVIQTNIIISTLVTWFEVYCERRALELEKEWIAPDIQNFFPKKPTNILIKLIRKYFKRYDKFTTIKIKAKEKWIELFEYIIRNEVSFQSYERCKEFYNKIYWIKFWKLVWIKNTDLEELQKFIWFRHKIVHEESILLWMLNQENVPPAEPIFPNQALADKAIETFDNFIQSLHQTTLRLKQEK